MAMILHWRDNLLLLELLLNAVLQFMIPLHEMNWTVSANALLDLGK